jgi:hypothetical protein
MEQRGVFPSHYALERYFGKQHQRSLDKDVNGHTLWHWLFQAVCNEIDKTKFVAAVNQGQTTELVLTLVFGIAEVSYSMYPPLLMDELGGNYDTYYGRLQHLGSVVLAAALTLDRINFELIEEEFAQP